MPGQAGAGPRGGRGALPRQQTTTSAPSCRSGTHFLLMLCPVLSDDCHTGPWEGFTSRNWKTTLDGNCGSWLVQPRDTLPAGHPGSCGIDGMDTPVGAGDRLPRNTDEAWVTAQSTGG